MKNRIQNSQEEILSYMSNWINQEDWCDMQCMANAASVGCPDALGYMANHLIGTGAIDSTRCYENSKTLEQDVELLAKRFGKISKKRQKLAWNRIFDNVLFISCDKCNHCSFVADDNERLYPEVLKQCWSCKKSGVSVERHEHKESA
jgi:hypothetical protein